MSQGPMETVLVGGRVTTMDPDRPAATAVRVLGRRIVAVGGDDEVLAAAGPHAEVVDLAGRGVLPGLHDAHLHLALWAELAAEDRLDLLWDEPRGIAVVVKELRARARTTPREGWIVGSGWERGVVRELADRHPVRSDLDDDAVPQAVVLLHRSQHAAWVNTEALRRAGIDASTPDPDGGVVVRDERGVPTGLLLEAAAELVLRHLPQASEAQRLERLRVRAAELSRLGVTSVTDPAATPQMVRDYHALISAGGFPLRMSCLLHWDWPSLATDLERTARAMSDLITPSGFGDDRLRIIGAKLFADGVPSLGTAHHEPDVVGGVPGCLLTGHGDLPTRTEEFEAIVRLLHAHRLSVQIHATGRAANRLAVRTLARVRGEDPWPAARHAVIHGTFLDDGLAALAAEADISVVTNGLVLWYAADAWRARMSAGDLEACMPVGSLVAAGVRVADGSDAPVQWPDWRQSVATLVTREARGSGAVVGPAERVDLTAALAAWTIHPAYLSGQEHQLGSIRPGNLADLVLLEEDVASIDPGRLHTLTPVGTMLDGGWVYGPVPR
ncbi:amidohydrolase [Nocardioides sp. GXZ039]|uniref:amidohydrolase n=1 Tax=Nocardioides sp. GXZ039 TaxID=3136018 RepID=UPI0030F36F73